MIRPSVAFVVQRCGVEVNGGAEALCLMVARAMTAVWDVTVLTTCARDYMSWENFYPAGESWIDGVRVIRFPVDRKRNLRLFDDLSQQLMGRLDTATDAEQDRWMREQGPDASRLFDHLSEVAEDYDAFYFFTYLYTSTYFGLPRVAGRSVLVPFAHDEWPLYFNAWERIFGSARRLVFSTPEERALLHRRFPRLGLPGDLIGVGIDPPGEPLARRFTGRFGITNRYVLYLGRIDEAKNCPALIEYFDAFKERYDREGSDIILVLVGRAEMQIPARPWMRHVGFVDEQTKWDAIAGCEALIMPSHLESLSLVLLEAWRLGKPVLASGHSDVLVGQCRRSQGGLWFEDQDEFGVALKHVLYNAKAILGESGRRFVEEHYRWPAVIGAYENSLAALRAPI